MNVIRINDKGHKNAIKEEEKINDNGSRGLSLKMNVKLKTTNRSEL